MKTQLEQRLQELKAEFESGQKELAQLETKEANLKNTLLRISGAIQVLEEELTKDNQNDKKMSQPATKEKRTSRPEGLITFYHYLITQHPSNPEN